MLRFHKNASLNGRWSSWCWFMYSCSLVLQNTYAVSKEAGLLQINGSIILGGLFPIHKKSTETENKCDVFSEVPGYQYMEAMLFAIDQINKDPKLLPNITLGAQIYDTCQSTTIATDRAKEFIKMTLDSGPERGQLAGVVGPLSSGVSEAVANFLRVFEIPQISYSSTSVTLSNKDIYSYFLRTVAPDNFQAQAMVDLLQRYGWTYVSAINSAGTYGNKGMEYFVKTAKSKGICIDFKHELKKFPTDDQYKDVVKRMVLRASASNVSAVVLFCTQTDARKLLEAANNTDGAQRFTWIGSDGWSNRVDVTETAPTAAQGALTIMIRGGPVQPSFKEYFTSLTWDNYPSKDKMFFNEFWKSRFECYPPNAMETPSCQGNQDLKNITIEYSPVRVVINAVYAFAHALDALREEVCGNEVGLCAGMRSFSRSKLLKKLKKVSFEDWSLNATVEFDNNSEVSAMYDVMNFRKVAPGEYGYYKVAEWNGKLVDGKIQKVLIMKDDILWLKDSTRKPPKSFCSSECCLGEIRKIRSDFNFSCCWDCKPCASLQIVLNNTCTDGPAGWVPNTNRSGWVKRTVLYPHWSDSPSVLLIVLSLICLALTAFTAGVFLTHAQHRIVKASGRELSYVMLVGIALCFTIPFLEIAKPNDPLCYARNLVIGVAFAMCYAPLFMKINRIYRIFTSARSSVARPPLVTPKVQLLVTFGLVSIQLMFTTLWFIAKPLEADEVYYSAREELVYECTVDQLSYSVNLCYVIVLMILCTTYAFKTRHFPKNFNESKFIGITMYITCAVWIAFFPFYLNTDNSLTQAYLVSAVSVTVGLVTLVGLFAQKIYIVFYIHDIRQDDLVETANERRPKVRQLQSRHHNDKPSEFESNA